tara:strand:- start:1551 stop:2171 length:621 start_codon:yes stop_codon:yes gene_type:complete
LLNFLVDRKTWNLVINKLTPTTGHFVKEHLGKKTYYGIPVDGVLFLQTKTIKYGFLNKFTRGSGFIYYRDKSVKIEIEKAILEVLIEKKGLPEDIKYNDTVSKGSQFIVKQHKTIDLASIKSKGFVYFIRNENIYKIGITDNLLRRFNQLKPTEILNIVRCSNYQNLERKLHEKFKGSRIPQTEYFRLDKYQVEEVNIEMTKGAKF